MKKPSNKVPKSGRSGRRHSATETDAAIGQKIRIRRAELGMSQEDLGNKLGVSFQQIQKYEKGVNRISAGRIEQIATALEVPVLYLFDNGASRAEKEVESLLAIDPRFSLRLLRAYQRLDIGTKRHFVTLMESVAGLEHVDF